MLIDIANAVGGYLHDVFIGTADWGILIGYIAQAMFAMRFVVQWIASERAGRECGADCVLGVLHWRRIDAARLRALPEGSRVHHWASLRCIRVSAQSAIRHAQRRNCDGGVIEFAPFGTIRSLFPVGQKSRRTVRQRFFVQAEAYRPAARASAANPRSRSAIRSSGSSSPIWKRIVGPPGAHLVAVRYSVQSNRMARLSKPPQE